ncbi:uncharacterized protein L201_004330 [Kwoniella dendrophila CBS 6074]|uniref:Uncharacterized protein n=1 Tax=Kwoniella dendrophila CBS 6074 TaxID=1295534 RepID=A0AAX4JVW8_9TREE
MGLSDKVIPSERSLAQSIEIYSEENRDKTYQFIARTTSNQVVVQVRYDDENDTIGMEGYFTETPKLLKQIEDSQEQIWKLTVESGYQNQPGVKTLEEMKSWRYDGTNFPKRDDENSKPPWGDGTPPWEKEEDEHQQEKNRVNSENA